MKKNVIIQCRFSSTRLPGKIFKIIPETNNEYLFYVLDRLLDIEDSFDDLIIATDRETKPYIEMLLLKHNMHRVKIVIGSTTNVLQRFCQALYEYPCDVGIRVTSDNCFISRGHMKDLIDYHIKNNADYCITIGLPTGCPVETFKPDLLFKIHADSETSMYDREHVLTQFRNNPAKYKTLYRGTKPECNKQSYRYTLDTQEDWDFLYPILQKDPKISIERLIKEYPNAK